MKILEVKTLTLPEIKVLNYARFSDDRGYFSETYRKSDVENDQETYFLRGVNFAQTNEAYSKKGVFRGFHFQWNPYVDKMVRVIRGSMIDFALDIRSNSKTFGKIIGYELRSYGEEDYAEWIWVPRGFAHGLLFLEDSVMEYFCTGQWAPETERSISPKDRGIDWSLCDVGIKMKFNEIIGGETAIIHDKDIGGMTLEQWRSNPDSNNFEF